ncbi:MAG TPA: 2-phospho-L-lactate guanylyltransferase [Burkholderiales bacterium]|nr:2-phospho-L-lactate guanylyltransferase [Burkholderiales bacterium]
MNKNKYLHVVLPHRGVAAGKSRLSAVLDDAARSELNRWLLSRTLRIVAACLGEAQRCVVVSPCISTLTLARHAGASTLTERVPALGLNAALAQGAAYAAMLGAQRLLILPCDLPLLDIAAWEAMLALPGSDGDVVVAPDRHGTGTNAMLVDATMRAFAFGAGSLARHVATATARGARVWTCHHPALAFDLDTEADFSQWMHSSAALPPFLAARRAAA